MHDPGRPYSFGTIIPMEVRPKSDEQVGEVSYSAGKQHYITNSRV